MPKMLLAAGGAAPQVMIMVRLLAAIAVLLGTSGLAIAQEPARFQLVPDGQGFVRFDTQTGEVSYCRPAGDTWECVAVSAPASQRPDPTALEAELGAIRARLEETETALAELIGRRIDQLEAAMAMAPPGPASAVLDAVAAMEDQLALLVEANAIIAGLLQDVIARLGPSAAEVPAERAAGAIAGADAAAAGEVILPFGEELVRRLGDLVLDLREGLPP